MIDVSFTFYGVRDVTAANHQLCHTTLKATHALAGFTQRALAFRKEQEAKLWAVHGTPGFGAEMCVLDDIIRSHACWA
jgi:hypothetical protein